MGAFARQITLRRVAASVLAVLASLAAWFFLVREPERGGPVPARAQGVSPAAAELAGGLSAEELVDQVLLLGFEGTDADAPIVAELETRQLGGVIVGASNWRGADPGTALVAALRGAARESGRIPPLIVAAQESGEGRELADLPSDRPALDVGDAGDPAGAEAWAAEIAAALRESGFDMNLFPVADVATIDSPMAARALSDDPATVATLTVAAIRGCRSEEIACAPLHFPGLGAASQDTADGPATVGLDRASLAALDLQPFRAAIDAGAPALVLSLAFYSAYDPVQPAALTPSIASGLLRGELGFEGVAITDDLAAAAITATSGVPAAALEALLAGADLLQLRAPGQARAVREQLLAAYESGALPEERLREAAGRVLELKRELGLLAEA